MIIRSAASTSLCMSEEIECRVLKQKMRIELHLERLQFRLDQAFLQFRGMEFAFAVFPVVIKRLAHGDDDAIDQQIEMPGLHQQRPEGLRKSGAALPLANPGPHHHVSERERHPAQQVRRETSAPTCRLRNETAAPAGSPAPTARRRHTNRPARSRRPAASSPPGPPWRWRCKTGWRTTARAAVQKAKPRSHLAHRFWMTVAIVIGCRFDKSKT